MHHRLILLVAAAHLLAGAVFAQLERIGGELQINAYTTSSQNLPVVGMDDDGGFVVVWQSNGQDGNNYGVFGRRYDSAATPLAVEFQVNTVTLGPQRIPSLAVAGTGAFVVVWESDLQDGDELGVFLRRFDSTGSAIGGEIQVNTYTVSDQSRARVAADQQGDFVVVWHSRDQDGEFYGVFGRRFDSGGVPLATEFQVNSFTTNQQFYPAIAADTDGDFVVAWRSFQDYISFGIRAQRFSSAGTRLGAELHVNAFTLGTQRDAAVDLEPDGDFVVAWRGDYQDGPSDGILARRFASSGAPLTGDLQVNRYTIDDQTFPSVAVSGGDFVVAWQSRYQDGDLFGVFARRFSASGVAVGFELQVSSYTTGTQAVPVVAAGGTGRLVMAWASSGQDGNSSGVFGQRFARNAALDVDGDGAVAPLTDGLLVLRYELGFGGSTLTTGAVGDDCTRCGAVEIEAYLDGLGAALDVDGNGGALGPLTDGLLVLRFEFGFSGEALISGAVDLDGCGRCTGDLILAYLQTLD